MESGKGGLFLVVVADDLTGAADTGVQFLRLFGKIHLVSHRDLSMGASPPSLVEALTVYTNSRPLDPEDAASLLGCVAQDLRGLRPRWVYKKVDSCLRGNVGAEAEALMEGLEYDLTFIAPAFPAMGRITIEAIHLIHGLPLDQTELARDPVTPISDSRIDRLVAKQCRGQVGHIPLADLRGSQETLCATVRRWAESGVRHLAFDVERQEDLERIARAALALPYRVLLVGSAGLAHALSHIWAAEGGEDIPERAPRFGPGPKLFVLGTASEVTRRQAHRLVRTFPYTELAVSPGILADPTQARARRGAAMRLREALLAGDTILHIAEEEGTGSGTYRPSAPSWSPNDVVSGLGEVTKRALKDLHVGGLFLSGGDTAWRVLEALECRGICLEAEILPGMPYGRTMGGRHEGLSVITKAGAFGEEDALVKLHELWESSLQEEIHDRR